MDMFDRHLDPRKKRKNPFPRERGMVPFRCPQRTVANVAGVSQSTVAKAVKNRELEEDLESIVRFVLKHRLKLPMVIEDVDAVVNEWEIPYEELNLAGKKSKRKRWGIRKRLY